VVRDTMHGRSGASVDYYRTISGVPRVETYEDPRAAGRTLRAVRVDEVFEIATCSECWPDARIQGALAALRRDGVPPRRA
jgi:hypothetical protein